MSIDHEKIAAEVRTQFTCHHEKTELRKKPDKAGRTLISRQCLRCGQQQGNYVSPKQFTDPQVRALPEWDASLEKHYGEKFGDTMRSRFQKEKEKEREAFLKRHEAFLKSEIWQRLRSKVLQRAQYICEGCAEVPPHL